MNKSLVMVGRNSDLFLLIPFSKVSICIRKNDPKSFLFSNILFLVHHYLSSDLSQSIVNSSFGCFMNIYLTYSLCIKDLIILFKILASFIKILKSLLL